MSDPYWDYQDRVNYDYIFRVNMPIKYYVIGDEDDKDIHESQYEQISENIQEGIENLISNEDYNGEYFPEVCLGGVYPGVNEVSDKIEMYFGVILRDARGEITLENLKENILEYMWNLDSNIDFDSSTYGFTSEIEDVEPKSLSFEPKGKKENIEIDVIKEPKTEAIDVTDIDKKLVTESSLILNKLNEQCKLVLNDEGKVEKYLNESLVESVNFSKSSITKLVSELLKEGYEFQSSEGTVVDTDQSKEDLEKGIELVDELQELKDELTDKIDTLVNESVEIDFPSTEFTQNPLTPNQITIISLDKELNEEQINWLLGKLSSLDEFKEGLNQLCDYTEFDKDESLISIDDYIKNLTIQGGI